MKMVQSSREGKAGGAREEMAGATSLICRGGGLQRTKALPSDRTENNSC